MTDVWGYPQPIEFSDIDVWGAKIININNAAYAAYLVRADDADWNDKALSRPKLKDYSETSVSKGSVSGEVTIDVSAGNHQTMSLTGNATLTITNPPPASTKGFLFLDVTMNGYTLTFPASVKNPSGTQFAATTSATGETEFFLRTKNNGSTWRATQGETWL